MITMAPIEVRFYPQGDLWIASCPALDLSTQGSTFEEARYNLADALILFFESCARRGTLEQVLAEAGLENAQRKQIVDYLDWYRIPSLNRSAQACHA